jgi:hypothetical protein
LKVAYYDCFSGAGGDMILGSLMDSGLAPERLKEELDKLHLTHYDLQAKRVLKNNISACKALVIFEDSHHHRHLHDRTEIIESRRQGTWRSTECACSAPA